MIRRRAPLVALCWLLAATFSHSADPADIRRLVTVKFWPGRSGAAHLLYQQLVSMYQDIPAITRFRGYREVESPEPLDMVLMTSFRGIEGVGEAELQLREVAKQRSLLLEGIYARLADMTERHHDELVEMFPALEHKTGESSAVVVIESIRLVPGTQSSFEQLLGSVVIPWEREFDLIRSSETGRFVIADGWDSLRIMGFRGLPEYYEYLQAVRRHAWNFQLEAAVAARKRVILREDIQLSVR